LLADPAFQAKVKPLSVQMLADDLSAVFAALRESAAIPGRDGAADRRLLFEMTGIYQPTKRQINEDVGKPAAIEAEMVRAMLELEVPEHKWPPVILARWKAGMIQGVAKPVTSREVC
jgi:hypothetical protein